MAINLDKKEKKNSCLLPFLVVLVIIAALVAGIGLLWGVTGYIWFLRILGVIFAFVAFCGLSSASGVGCLITIICGIFAALCFWGGNTIEKNYAESMPSVSTSSSYGSDVSSQTPTYENEVSSQVEEDNPYIDNRLQTGDSPYKNIRLSGNESTIEVKTSAGDENDVVVIIKHNGKIVRNAYIQGGDSYQFSVPNGTYQVFFYGGKGWNPDKKMAGGYTGGFITNESFSKDNAVTLDYQGLNYELIPQRNGNFNTELSSETEMFSCDINMDYESCRDFLKRLGYVILICIVFHFKLDNFAFMIAFILIVIALFCFSYYKAKQQKADQEMDRIMNAPSGTVSAEVLPLNNNNMEENQNFSTRDLCAEVLRKLNCDVQFDDENEYNMHFSYQGENFSVETWEDGLMITIWDTWWGTVDLDNLDDVSRVRKAINTINVRQGFTLMYSIDEKSQKFAVHTKRQCLLIPQIPQIENYMVAMLTGFFDAQRSFKEEYDRLRLEEEANAKV